MEAYGLVNDFKNGSSILYLGNENHDSTKKAPVCPLKISHFHKLYIIWIKHIIINIELNTFSKYSGKNL